MEKTNRKAMVAAYKQQGQRAGIYCVVCTPSMQQWVGAAPNVDTIFNRLIFTLKTGRHRCRSLTEAFAKHGETAFGFEVLDVFDDSEKGYSYDVAVKERLPHHAVSTGGEVL